MSNFTKFLEVNRLKRKDIASFLGVSGAFITQISQGTRPLPPEKLALINNNAYGWDTSMLTSQEETPEPAPDKMKISKVKANYQAYLGEGYGTAPDIMALLMRKDEEIIQLHRRIWELEQIVESKGGEDAQDASSSSDARVG